MKTVKIFEIVEILDDDLKKHYFYRGGELDGQPFSTEPRVISGRVIPAKTPEQLRNEEKQKKLDKISSVGNIIKSHEQKEDQMPQSRVQKPSGS